MLRAYSSVHYYIFTYLCTAAGRYLQEAVHVGLHVGDGHPLHDDVTDASLQTLPFITSNSGGVDTDCSPVGRPAHTARVDNVID